jgi:hypothetical protein
MGTLTFAARMPSSNRPRTFISDQFPQHMAWLARTNNAAAKEIAIDKLKFLCY